MPTDATTAADDAIVLAFETELALRARKPYAGSLVRRVETFFNTNPHEWLTWADLCTKFDCSPQQARDAVNHLRNSGRVDFEVIGVVRVKEGA